MESRVSSPDIAIIGAGMAGIACARRLTDDGFSVRVYDKSRGIGGRIATRRTEAGLRFDHGIPFIDASVPEMGPLLDTLLSAGSAAISAVEAGSGLSEGRCYGLPGMSGLLRPLADGLVLNRGSEVSEVARRDLWWELSFKDGRAPERCDILICAVPAPQACALLKGVGEITDPLTAVAFDPCWTFMLGFDESRAVDPSMLSGSARFIADAYRENDKPGRADLPMDCWVAHATPEWSIRHLELDRPEVTDRLRDVLLTTSDGSVPEPAFVAAHRWRYARTRTALGRPFAATADGSLFVGGDWCLGDKVEHALASGAAIAAAIVEADAARGSR